jgi:uncharacterized protein YbaR (Trm112 family)/SAM-dependent methyltransferase
MLGYLLDWRRFDIARTDTVLEIGSGGHPLIRSDILCDKYPFASYERFLHAPLVRDRPIVAGDAMCLPFRDKSVDFIYCNDLAEHLDEPHHFFDECSRVGRKGVIITPSMLAERMFGWDYHAVMFDVRDGGLVIHRKTEDNWAWFGGTFHELWLADPGFRQVFARHPEIFRMTFEWQDRIPHAYAQSEHPPTSAWRRVSSDDKPITAAPTVIERAKRGVRSLASTGLRRLILRRPEIDLASVIACPICKGPLTSLEQHALHCTDCGAVFPREQGIPMLLPESRLDRVEGR